MIALDFFLYDNRTLSPRWGRDWGLKAATGALADRTDLKAAFDRYCGATPDHQGQLRGFDEAIGGVRSPGRDGYLLCVTLESSDFFGRPSWAVACLWCPGRDTLEQVLSSGDPIGSARALLGIETPPSALEIRSANVLPRPKRRRVTAETAFYRFQPKSTVQDVTSLLLEALRDNARLPNVLGITATSRLAGVAKEFDRVYCLPMDERTERALARVQSPPEPEVEEPPIPSPKPTASPVPEAPEPLPSWESTGSEQRSSLLGLVSLGLLMGVVMIVIGFLTLQFLDRPFTGASREPSPPLEEETPFSEETPLPEISDPEERSEEALLTDLEERLEELKALEPEILHQSAGFKIAANLPVLPEHQKERDRVQKAYEALAEVRDRMVKRQDKGYVSYYYFEEGGRNTEPEVKLQKISEILGEAPLGGEDCEVLKNAFGFEFETGDSIVRRWCESLGRLEKTNVSLQSLTASPTPPL